MYHSVLYYTMSKTIMALLAIVAIASVMGISFTSADAVGKPIVTPEPEFVLEDVPYGIMFGTICEVNDTVANLIIGGSLTTWPDKDMKRYVVTITGELFDGNENVVGEINGSETTENHSEGNGASQYKLKITVKCSGAGSEKLIVLHNIDKSK